jgi:hypothetical protein
MVKVFCLHLLPPLHAPHLHCAFHLCRSTLTLRVPPRCLSWSTRSWSTPRPTPACFLSYTTAYRCPVSTLHLLWPLSWVLVRQVEMRLWHLCGLVSLTTFPSALAFVRPGPMTLASSSLGCTECLLSCRRGAGDLALNNSSILVQ